MSALVLALCMGFMICAFAALAVACRERRVARRAIALAEQAIVGARGDVADALHLARQRAVKKPADRQAVLVVDGVKQETGYELPDPHITFDPEWEGVKERTIARDRSSFSRVLTNAAEALRVKHSGIHYIEQEHERLLRDNDTPRDGVVVAALCYALAYPRYARENPPVNWPWDPEAWNPADNELGNLIIAGALMAVQIDRLKERL